MTAFEPGASEVLTVGETRQPARDRVACQQAGADHHRRVGRVRARRDGRDRHRPVPERRRVARAGDRPGGDALGLRGRPSRKLSPQVGQRDPVLGPPRTGQRRLDGREVQLERDVELGPVARLAPQALGLGVALDQVDARRRAAGEPQVRQRLVVDREQRRRRAELGAHVRDRRPVGQRQAGEPVAGELDERPRPRRTSAASR